MASNDEFNYLSESEAETNPFSEEASLLAPSEIDSLNQSGRESEIASSSSKAISEDQASKAYIFKYGLFKKTILPSLEGQKQEMQITCTM